MEGPHKSAVVFSDVDGTICFHQEANGIVNLGEGPEGLMRVKDPSSTIIHLAHDVSTSSYSVYLAEITRQKCCDLQATCDIVLVTGGRPSTCQKRAHLFPFAKAFIAENGGVIYDANFVRDEDWWQHLQPQRDLLAEVKAYIKSYDWHLDDVGRTSGIRVRLRDNPHKTPEKFLRLCEVVRLPPGLQSTINLENLDIILEGAGKDHAAAYYMDSHQYAREQSHGIGDDINDAPFLRLCAHSYVLASAFPPVLAEAQLKGWTVSKHPTFEGIHEILDEIQKRLQR